MQREMVESRLGEGPNAPTVRTTIQIPLLNGRVTATFYSFNNLRDAKEHFAIEFGAARRLPVPLVRIHSECITGDLFGSQFCDCGAQLVEAIGRLESEGGYLLYLRQEGRGIGLYAKLEAYRLQRQGMDTFEANRRLHFPDDLRDYGVAAEMLESIGIRHIRLLSNNPDKVEQLISYGIEVLEAVPTAVHLNPHNAKYLAAKVRHAGHKLQI